MYLCQKIMLIFTSEKNEMHFLVYWRKWITRLISYFLKVYWFYRCGTSRCLCHTRIFVCPPTLWNPSRRIPICTHSGYMATMYQFNWCVQYCALEPPCLPGTLTILHVQILEEDSKGRLDVIGWDSVVYDRWDIGELCLLPFIFKLNSLFFAHGNCVFQALKQCLLILATFHSCQSR